MNTPPKVLLLPPRPPAAINTVMMASAGLILSIASWVTYAAVSGFPQNAPVESIFAMGGAFLMFVLGFILGLNAVINETKRNQFQHVVERYTKITGDKRYMPYILPVRSRRVAWLFAVTIAWPVVNYILSWVY